MLRQRRPRLAVAFLLAGVFVWTAPARAQAPSAAPLFAPHPDPPAAPPPGRPAALRRAVVRIDFERLLDALPPQAGGRGLSERLNLNLFPDAGFTALRNRVETTGTGYVWIGGIENLPTGSVTLAVTGNVMSGSVVTAEGTFAIRYAGADAHTIELMDLADMPPEREPLVPPPLQNFALADGAPPTAVDDGSRIDLLVVYTAKARVAAGGKAAIESLIDLGVSETNQAYANSGVIQRLRLRRKEEIVYTEPGNNMGGDLTRLQGTGDGFMDSVHSLRNTYGADLTQLIVNSPDSCGIAYVLDPMQAGYTTFAFGVTHYSCISPNYSFAHEMGHNMGLHHDIAVDPSSTLFTYSHGYVNQAVIPGGGVPSQRWRTIMAYNDQCAAQVPSFNCTRLLYFSNPNNLYPTSGSPQDPMGNVSTAHASLALDNTRVTVANFRAEILEPLDNFADARHIFINNFTDTLPTATFSSEGADPTPTCGGGVKSKSAWYRFTPRGTGTATIGTLGSGYDTILSVYTGTTGSFVAVGCNDDASATPQSQLAIPVSANTTYSIMVSAKNNDGGSLSLTTAIPIDKRRAGQLTGD